MQSISRASWLISERATGEDLGVKDYQCVFMIFPLLEAVLDWDIEILHDASRTELHTMRAQRE